MIAGWLDARGVDAVLVRPDFYVFGTATGAVEGLLGRLADTLRLARDEAPALALTGDRR